MDSKSITPAWNDKALYVTILGMFLPAISAKVGIDLSPDKIAAIITIAVGYIASHKWKSATILKAELAADAKALAQKEIGK
jgi:hypothetical protein